MSNTITVDTLYNQLQSQMNIINGLSGRITPLESNSGTYISYSSLQSSISELQSNIDSINNTITGIESQLNKITLPSDTRYYLEESEITDFRNHFRQLRAMMSDLEKSRQAFIRLSARYNMTNSSL